MIEEIVDSIMFYRRQHGGAWPTRVEVGREEWRRLGLAAKIAGEFHGGCRYVYGVPVVEGNW